MKNLKAIWLAMSVGVLLVLAGCGKSVEAQPNPSASPLVTAQSDQGKQTIPHFEQGVFTGKTHLIDLWLYYELIDIAIASGHDPTPQNIDRLYHLWKGGL